ncbi:MAG: hypothetical protein AB1449_12445 [Chloroflexota bacterium]
MSDLVGDNQEELLTSFLDLEPILVWSPDGVRAIVQTHGGDWELYLADTQNGSLGPCLSCGIEDAIGGVAFSPDGRSIALGADGGLYLVGDDGAGRRLLAAVPNARWMTWSPDGAQLIFVGGVNPRDLYRIDVGGGNLVQLTQSPSDRPITYTMPQWSPLGDRIAVHVFDEDGLFLALISPDGTGRTDLAEWTIQTEILDPGSVWPPQWSPDGRQILFESSGPMGDLEIFVINADGTGLRNLTNSPGRDSDPVWSPDGRYIAFVTNRDGNDEIYVMNADGTDQRNVSQSPILDECCPGWRP